MVSDGVLWFVAVVAVVRGYSSFREKIPNGNNVPNPCEPNSFWKGVGHENIVGGGPRNPFGVAFKKQGFAWTRDLCLADSDGDGKTNGAELGDANCTWTPGSTPTSTTGLSHPGICEPINSELCQRKNKFQVCQKTEFVCDGINEPDVIEVDIRLTETAVPAKVTTYICQSFDLDESKDYHVIAAEPIIDNVNVMHHIVIYGCGASINVTALKSPQECFMETMCEELMFLWAYGGGGVCIHPSAGYLVGKNGFKSLLMEMHWNNPFQESTYRDSSGMKLYMTPNLRIHDAGVSMIGQNLLVIPPGKEHVSINSTCSSDCTKQIITGTINVFGVLNHMHYLGSSAFSQVKAIETGKVIPLGSDTNYDYNSPKYHSFDDPHVVYPGDEFNLVCNFNSTSRNKTTFFGFGSSSEMCLAFIMYYPKQNWTSHCTSTGNIDDCAWDKPFFGGCDRGYLDPTNEKAIKVYSDVSHNCLTSICLEECKTVVREIRKNPCFQYPLKFIIQQQAIDTNSGNITSTMETLKLFYKMDSCAAELERESIQNERETRPDHTSGSTRLGVSFIVSMATGILAMLL